MSAVEFCKRCLYSTAHPLGLTIDDDGICSGCRIHEEKDWLDWQARWHELGQIVAPYRSRTGRTYDCIVPVSGAQDSYFIVYLVKERLGLNPLLVSYNKYFNTRLGIRNLANLRTRCDCDILIQNVNPLSVKKITRTTLRQFGSVYWPCIAGQTVFPVQTAIRYEVPLIVWGAHQGLEQVGMFSHLHNVQMTRRYRKDHDLMGYEADDLLGTFDTLREEDIWQYRYPQDSELHAVGVVGIYLGNYVRWDPKAQHEQMIRMHGYRGAAFARTFDTYDFTDCFNYMDIHDLLKLYKNGYSKVTDHACREIRHGRLGRDHAAALVRGYEQQPLRFLDLFCEWLNVKPRGLSFIMDQYRNPEYWTQTRPGAWAFRALGELAASVEPASRIVAPDFHAADSLSGQHAPAYTTIGKGYP